MMCSPSARAKNRSPNLWLRVSSFARALGWWFLLCLLLAAPRLSRAAPAEQEAMAQSLFEAGRVLVAQGNLAEACSKFSESNRLDPSAGTLLNLGKCYEAQGRTASAWAAYKNAIAVGRAKGQLRHVEAAEGFVAEVEPRLSKLTVSVVLPVGGLQVFRDDVEIAAASRDVPLAVDPGFYRMTAVAPGHQNWEQTLRVEPGKNHRLEIPALTRIELARPDPLVPKQAEQGMRPELFWTGIASGTLGLAALGIGAGFGASTLSDASAAEADASLCPKLRCSEAGWLQIESAREKALAANVLLSLGGVAALTGGTLVVLGLVLPKAESEVLARVGPFVVSAPQGAIIGLAGTL